jgi:nitrogen fixation/metabolism regulation signal transduction histidine kinase
MNYIVMNIQRKKSMNQNIKKQSNQSADNGRILLLLDSVYNGIVSIDEQKRVRIFNKSAEQIFAMIVMKSSANPIKIFFQTVHCWKSFNSFSGRQPQIRV